MVVKCEKFVKMCRLCCKNAICDKSIAIYIEIWYNNNKSFDIKTASIFFFTLQKFRGNHLKKRCKKSKNDTLVLKDSKNNDVYCQQNFYLHRRIKYITNTYQKFE